MLFGGVVQISEVIRRRMRFEDDDEEWFEKVKSDLGKICKKPVQPSPRCYSGNGMNVQSICEIYGSSQDRRHFGRHPNRKQIKKLPLS
jgi:hypothetical protein